MPEKNRKLRPQSAREREKPEKGMAKREAESGMCKCACKIVVWLHDCFSGHLTQSLPGKNRRYFQVHIHGKTLDHSNMPNAISNSLILGKLGEMLLLAAAVKSRW